MILPILLSLFLNADTFAAPSPTPIKLDASVPTVMVEEEEYSNEKLELALKPRVIILLDSSGSMGQLLDKQKSKMFYAKKLFGQYLRDQWREKAEVGMITYGSRRKHDCGDYFQAIPMGERNLTKIDTAVKKLSPTGMTPIANSLELAIEQLKGYPGPKRVMIFTDGEETCGGDSCKILEKAIQEKVFDLEMFVTGIGLSEKSKDLDKLRCLGKTFGAKSPEQLQNVINNIDNQIKQESKDKLTQEGLNLFVDSPQPDRLVKVFKLVNGKRGELVISFVASHGAKLPPGEYTADVLLDPVYTFKSFRILPKKKLTLRVRGTGLVTVKFLDGLLEVEILNKDKKVVQSFQSDEPTRVKEGTYDIRIFADPFFEKVERGYKIVPNGHHDLDMVGIGAVQVDYPGTAGLHVFTSDGKDMGNYLTNFPFVIKSGGYRFYVNEKCNIEGITVRPEKSIQRLKCLNNK